jgi:hypothetical protein
MIKFVFSAIGKRGLPGTWDWTRYRRATGKDLFELEEEEYFTKEVGPANDDVVEHTGCV